MPKRKDIKKILIIGAGPIVIGQGCEFDYSGTQACKALRDEGYKVILINSNPATIMTDPDVADKTYIEPITVEILEKIILKEKPSAILPTMGGQTALNMAVQLEKEGILDKYKVELIGAKSKAISNAEDRDKFRKCMRDIGLDLPKSKIITSLKHAKNALKKVGLPAIIRPSFTLGGSGGGIAYKKKEYYEIVKNGLFESPKNQVLIEESLEGWKEFEMEVVRDKNDNCIIICSIENVDPMGTHTGDSVTVAPALTLTDKEFQIMRNASIACLRKIGVETGGSNVQFAINPVNGRMVIIEMNPRVSRSSALASKATGFPIAKIATKLAIGYTLDELTNEITGSTPASFEPTIDYVVTKIPRFTFEKFQKTEASLGTSMKSIGEAMAIGRNFKESFQKALVSLETGLKGLDIIKDLSKKEIYKELEKNTPNKFLVIADAFRNKININKIYKKTKVDMWFLKQIKEIIDVENILIKFGIPKNTNEMNYVKSIGFGDEKIAKLTKISAESVKNLREKLNVLSVYKKIDTCAAEFKSLTPYMYSTYQRDVVGSSICESKPTGKKKIIILGGGPNRIGQGIEFDYCCCQASYALKESGYETIMINCNPETVSTDYDTSDRLYFEPLIEEYVINIIKKEQSNGNLLGIITQFGGQTPIKLAKALDQNQLPILGTQYSSIDLAENRERFKNLLNKENFKQAESGIAKSKKEAINITKSLGYPVVIRPSYVLGGRAMEIIHNENQLNKYIDEAIKVSGSNPVLIDKFLNDAIEVDVDAIADGEKVFVAGIMEHIEEAGIHSGDSACSVPPYSLKKEIIDEIESQTTRLAGEKIEKFNLKKRNKNTFAIKEAVFPFNKFPNVDVLLGPEMKSTGEVMGIDKNFGLSFAKSQMACGNSLPVSGTAFISVKDKDKKNALDFAKKLKGLNFKLCATSGTAKYLNSNGIHCKKINKVRDGSPHIVESLNAKNIELVINTTEGTKSVSDSYSLRRSALINKIPYCTTLAAANACIQAIDSLKNNEIKVKAIQEL
jgi:carbamoyl-phosphate synthase large subunit